MFFPWIYILYYLRLAPESQSSLADVMKMEVNRFQKIMPFMTDTVSDFIQLQTMVPSSQIANIFDIITDL